MGFAMSVTNDEPDATLESGLNPDQLDAVVHRGSPLLVVAGAGSGKTRVLTHRIAHLIDEGVPPSAILAITFTNKAAEEMRHRVAALVGPITRGMWISTFHSACVRILRANADRLGYPRQFSIYDQADAQRLTGYVIRDLHLDSKRFPPRGVHGAISRWKNELVSPAEAKLVADNPFARKHADVFAEYQLRLQRAGAMDFDDLLTKTVELLRQHPDVLAGYQQRFQHLLVDEYQDTNLAQNELVLMLGAAHGNVTVVGDTDQCLPGEAMISTPTGPMRIEGVRVGDQVLGTAGASAPAVGTVVDIRSSSTAGPLIRVVVASGDRRVVVRATPFHLVPARLVPIADTHVVYLMYRADRGYRIGRTTGMRSPGRKMAAQPGHIVRANQEHADALWVLRCCPTVAEASYYESFFAARYGLPTACFHSVGRNLAMDDTYLQRLYSELDTELGAKELMDELLLHPDFPHHRPQNGARRSTLNLTMFSDARGTSAYHRVQWSSNRMDLAESLAGAGVAVRSAKGSAVRYETSWKDYGRALDDAWRVATAGGLDIKRRMAVGGAIYDVMPLSHVRPGMEVLIEVDGRLEVGSVESSRVEEFEGRVFDLEVTPTHNYVADGMVVHNSVYRFRGADFRNILQFEDAFPATQTIVLDQNYRSSQTILDAANAVISNNDDRKDKNLWTDAGRGDKIVRYHADDEGDEARFVASTLMRLHDDGERWGDTAVLYRTNAQSRIIEEAFMRLGIPYRVVGGTRFYDRREIKDAMGYLKAVVNTADEVSIKRVINVPKRGIGEASIAKLDAFAAAGSMTFFEAMHHASEAGVGGASARAIDSFAEQLDRLSALARQVATSDDDAPATDDDDAPAAVSPADLLQCVLDESGYLAELEAIDTVEAHGRLENLGELVSSAREFTRLDEFLEQVALVADTDELPDDQDSGGQVVLLTLHSAKGLEFATVFLIGMEDGIFPHIRSLTEPDELAEERRLAYVGITRAERRLYLTSAWSRTMFGTTMYNVPSRFLDEIPSELLDEQGDRARRPGRSSLRSRDSGAPPYRRRRDTQGSDEHRERVVDAAMAAGRGSAPAPSKSQELGLRIGDDVEHPAFGEGVVIDIQGSGDNMEATINFPGSGTKHLALEWAPLRKIPR